MSISLSAMEGIQGVQIHSWTMILQSN
jgi:hypothetical protein